MAKSSRYPALDGGRAFEFLTKGFRFEERMSRELERLIQRAERQVDDEEINVVKRSKKKRS